MRWPRVLPPVPFARLPVAPDTAWCQSCWQWQRFDVIPAHDPVPAFVICCRCGGWITDYDLEATG